MRAAATIIKLIRSMGNCCPCDGIPNASETIAEIIDKESGLAEAKEALEMHPADRVGLSFAAERKVISALASINGD